MGEEIIIGIDLGTTFSAVAFINSHGKPEIIHNREGERTTPSVIFFDDDGIPIVGEEARNQAIIEPRRTVRSVKRDMGNPSYRFNVDGEDFFPEDISAIILKKLKNDAESVLGTEISKAVISVPAYFKDSQREATRQAGKIAGLDVLHIINEPTAAALAYGLNRVEEDQTILVYDFGGGTFDVTIMEIKGNEFNILVSDGDAQLGGKDIDGLLVEYFAEEFLREYGVDLRTEAYTHQDLWEKAEIAKKDLSFRNSVTQTLSFEDKALRIDLDRETFDGLIEDIVQQTEDCLQSVIKNAELDWSSINTILLAGGSSRIPTVKAMIERVTGKAATRDMNPDECVAMGASIQAILTIQEKDGGNSTNEVEGISDIVVHDVASHSLGVKALASDHKTYINSIIIPKFTRIPCEKTKIYATGEDSQKKVEIEVLQGEDENPKSPEVEFIGKAGLRNLPPHKAGDLLIEVTLKYNADGVIEVVAKELQSGQTNREIVMQKASGLSDEIIEEKRKILSGQEF